jgi:hypothetical protein
MKMLQAPMKRFYTVLSAGAPTSGQASDFISYFEIFRYRDPDLVRGVDACGSLCSMNVLHTLPHFLSDFPRVLMRPGSPMPDRIIADSPFATIWPTYTDTIGRRACLYFVCDWMLSELFRSLFEKIDVSRHDDLLHAWRQLLALLLTDSPENPEMPRHQIEVFCATRWAGVVRLASKTIPGVVMDDLLEILSSISSHSPGIQAFFLRVFSQAHVLVFDDTFRSTTLQALRQVHTRVVPTGAAVVEFVRNIFGFALLRSSPFGEELNGYLRAAKLGDSVPLNSTMILFYTLKYANDKIRLPLFPTILAGTPTAVIVDTLATFVAVLNGRNYLPAGEALPDWRPGEAHMDKIPRMFVWIYANSQRFGGCQRELAQFLIRANEIGWLSNFGTQLKPGFVKENERAVLMAAKRLLPTSENDDFSRFIEQLCAKIMSAEQGSSGSSHAYYTLDCAQGVAPIALDPMEYYSIEPDLDALESGGNVKINRQAFSQDVSVTPGLKVISTADYGLTPLLCAIDVFPFVGSGVDNLAPLLLSTQASVSAATLAALCLWISIHKNADLFDAIFNLPVKTSEDLYIVGYALGKMAATVVETDVSLRPATVQKLFAWCLLLISSPIPMIRELAWELAASLPVEQTPDFTAFIEVYDRQICLHALRKIVQVGSCQVTEPSHFLSFRNVSRCASVPFYYIFLTSMLTHLSGYLNCCPDVRFVISQMVSDLIGTNRNRNDIGLLHMITLWVGTSIQRIDALPIIPRGLTLAHAHGLYFFVSFILCVNASTPFERESKLLKVDSLTCDSVHAYALTYSLRDRPFDTNLAGYERQLRRVVDHLRFSKMFREHCALEVDPSYFEAKQFPDETLFNIAHCINKVCTYLFGTYSAPQRSGLLVHHSFPDIDHPFRDKLWFLFLYNFLSLSRSEPVELVPEIQSAYGSLLRVTTIPVDFVPDIMKSIVHLDSVPLLAATLTAGQKALFAYFLDRAIDSEAFFQAVASQFRSATTIEADLIALKSQLDHPDSFSLVVAHFGLLLALCFFYFADPKISLRRSAARIFYCLVLFSFVLVDTSPRPILSSLDLLQQHINSVFQIPHDFLIDLSQDCASFFHFAVSSFVASALQILNHQTDRTARPHGFMAVVAPWFGEVECDSMVFTELLNASYHPQAHFKQDPIATEALPILSAVVARRPVFVLNFLLAPSVHSRAMCVYICEQYGTDMVRFLTNHLRFDFWLFAGAEYENTVLLVLDVLLKLIEDSSPCVKPYLHLIFLFSFIHYASFNPCIDLLARIDGTSFLDGQVHEMCEETFRWASSCGDLEVAMTAVDLLGRITSFRDTEKCDQLLSAVSVVCRLANESGVATFEDELEYIASVLSKAAEFDPASPLLKQIVIRLLASPLSSFTLILHAVLKLLSNVLIPQHPDLIEVADDIVFALLALPVRDSETAEAIIRVLTQIADAGNAASNLIVAAVLPFSSTLKEGPKKDARLKLSHSNLSGLMCELFKVLSAEHCYLVMRFYVTLANVYPAEFAKRVLDIAMILRTMYKKRSPISPAVFAPLARAIDARTEKSTDAVEFLAAVGPLEDGSAAGITAFPFLDLPFRLNQVPFRPVRREFLETPTFRVIERALAMRPKSEFERQKEALSAPRLHARVTNASFNPVEAAARITDWLARTPANEEVVPSTIFGLRGVDIALFAPSFSEVDAINVEGFPALFP